MKINFLFIIIFLVLSKIVAQDAAIKIFTIEQDNILFQTSYLDKAYNLNDTLVITYIVENKNNFDIYVFDDNSSGNIFCSYQADTTKCFSKLEFGGNWMHNLETYNIIFLRKIKGFSNYKYILKILLTGKTNNLNCGYQILSSLYYLSDIIFYSYFLNIGYIKDDNSEINIETDSKELILDPDKGFLFEKLIKRNLIGPLYIKYIK
jgi:hypothetical protein